jgi:hypothetical protein
MVDLKARLPLIAEFLELVPLKGSLGGQVEMCFSGGLVLRFLNLWRAVAGFWSSPPTPRGKDSQRFIELEAKTKFILIHVKKLTFLYVENRMVARFVNLVTVISQPTRHVWSAAVLQAKNEDGGNGLRTCIRPLIGG